MRISYRTKKLGKTVTSFREMAKHYGNEAKRVSQRLQELSAAPHLAMLASLPGPGCHELTGDKKGCFAVSTSGNRRIIFKPLHDPLPIRPDRGLDWEKITDIVILEINIDYH